MPVYTIELEGKTTDIEADMGQEEFDQYINSDEGYAEAVRQLQQLSSQAPAQDLPVPDIASAADQAVRDYADSLSAPQRFLIGTGKAVNDLVSGVQQLFGNEEVDERIKREEKLYGILDEGVGAEDFGEFAGTVGTYLAGGSAGATLKGSVLLGGLLEGLKATDDGSLSDRATNAAIGAIGGYGGFKVGEVVAKRLLQSAAQKSADSLGVAARTALEEAPDPLTAKATIELASGNTKRLLEGGGIRMFGRVYLRGASEATTHLGKVTNAQVEATERAGRTAIERASKELYAKQAQQIADLRKLYFRRTKLMYDKLTPEAQKAAVFQSVENALKQTGNVVSRTSKKVHKSLENVLSESVVDLGNGAVGIDPAKFIKATGFMNKEAQAALPETAQRQLKAIINLMQRNSGKVLSNAEIEAQLAELAKINSKQLERVIATPINPSQKKIANDILDMIINKAKVASTGTTGAVIATQEQATDAAGVQPQQLTDAVRSMF